MWTGWNWVGIILWIIVVAYIVYVIHFIRVKQLMLIVRTKSAFAWKNTLQYTGLLVVALAALVAMSYLTFFRQVDMSNHEQIEISTKYHPLVLTPIKEDFYYVQANRRSQGDKPVISYSYWLKNSKYTISGHNGTIVDGDRPMNVVASVYPWNRTKLKQEDTKNGKAFVAVMSIRYKKTFLNGLGMRSGHLANRYTMIRVPSEGFVYHK
ncbi:LVIS_2131 family protein [Paucilactobacillus wasatchensis]|uniref:Uncharacterized protein n=1 Tax=Paucilactobacillus wasatchensis TaxID=1335616 RepID=A0A0D1A4R7_9LACO|nr:LVIS_2131 family protein [Paucilactobacillus wasatchensis]KIS02895.1 hypothetical protein WDC_1538 [Paucilactobacillus wasatchensis]